MKRGWGVPPKDGTQKKKTALLRPELLGGIWKGVFGKWERYMWGKAGEPVLGEATYHHSIIGYVVIIPYSAT